MARGSGSASGNGMQSSAAVKRILKEVAELAAESERPGALFTAAPLESDLFEMHFTVRGPPETAFEGGLYHGRILLPPEYPLKAPEIMFLTPNGRFETGTRICLSVTSHHEELWQPSWGIRTILTALVGFMPSKPTGLGALDYPDKERKALAKKSLGYVCPRCGAAVATQLPPMAVARPAPVAPSASAAASVEPLVAAAEAGSTATAPTVTEAVPSSGDSPMSTAAAVDVASHTAGPAGAPAPQPVAAAGIAAMAGAPATSLSGASPSPATVSASPAGAASVETPQPTVAAELRQRGTATEDAATAPEQAAAVLRRPSGDRDVANDSGGEETLLMAAWFVASVIGGLLARRLALALF